MNVAFPLCIYAAVQKKLGGKLEFPGDIIAWDHVQDQSSAMMNAYLEEWAVLCPAASNQAFNASDGSHFTWGMFWPKFAAHYGLEYTAPDHKNDKYQQIPMAYDRGSRAYVCLVLIAVGHLK